MRAAALADLDEIWDYTEEQWGVEQAESYLSALGDASAKLQMNPMLGSDRSDIHEGLRKLKVKSHNIFYLVHNEIIDVVRVLHFSMDVDSLLK